MNGQNDNPYFLFTTDILSGIRDQFFKQKRQAIVFAERLIQSKDLSYIEKIYSCLPIDARYFPQLDEQSRKYMQLQRLDADMRRLYIICEILKEEKSLPESRLYFLKQVDTFGDLMRKYIRITFLLRRIEFSLRQEALEEAEGMLKNNRVSICAFRKIMDYEAFADKENKYDEILRMKEEVKN